MNNPEFTDPIDRVFAAAETLYTQVVEAARSQNLEPIEPLQNFAEELYTAIVQYQIRSGFSLMELEQFVIQFGVAEELQTEELQTEELQTEELQTEELQTEELQTDDLQFAPDLGELQDLHHWFRSSVSTLLQLAQFEMPIPDPPIPRPPRRMDFQMPPSNVPIPRPPRPR